jgi:hypothetical protein
MAPEDGKDYLHFDATGAVVRIEGDRAIVSYRLDGIDAEARYQLDGPALVATLRVTNHGSRNIEEVMFPLLRGLGPIPGGQIIWPAFWNRRYEDPFSTDQNSAFGKTFGGDHHTWNEWSQKQNARYPGHLCSAWCDYGTDAHGIGIEGRQQDFSIMDFFFHKIVEKDQQPVRRTLDMMIVHPRRVKPGESYTSPPVRIVLHEGGWQTVADAHREWLETWVRKPDRPRKFADSIGWHFYFMKHQDGLEVHRYEDLPRMAEAALAAGCPYLMLFGWQTGGHDNNYFYRYVPNDVWGGEAALKAAVARCREMGVEILPFFNGTLANIEMPEHKEFGYRWEAHTRAGHPYYAGDWARCNFDVPMRNRAMLHHEICFCEGQRAYFLDNIRRIVQQYGFGNTQLDQISEKMFCCYNPAHGHDYPDRAMVDGLEELLEQTRACVRQVNPEGVMVSECLNDFTGQWCDSSWDWNILLPFPDPIFYTLPWLMGSHEIDALEYDEVNKAFAYKLHLDLKIDGGDAPITKYPEFAAHVRRNAELRRRVTDYYALAEFRGQERVRISGPGTVLVNVYRRRANGVTRAVGIVAAEIAGTNADLVLEQDWSASGEMRGESNIEEGVVVPCAPAWPLRLQAYEVKVYCLDLEPTR